MAKVKTNSKCIVRQERVKKIKSNPNTVAHSDNTGNGKGRRGGNSNNCKQDRQEKKGQPSQWEDCKKH